MQSAHRKALYIVLPAPNTSSTRGRVPCTSATAMDLAIPAEALREALIDAVRAEAPTGLRKLPMQFRCAATLGNPLLDAYHDE